METQQQKPSVGRIVHYRGPGTANGQFQPTTYPAVVTRVHTDTCVNLFVMTDVGHMNLTSITLGESPEEVSRWTWPPRT
jgi:hypothetical protein